MKRYIHSNSQMGTYDWLSADGWYSIEDNEEFEEMWDKYLSGPEDMINTKLNVFVEPSVQGSWGSIFIFDESNGDRFETVEVDFQDWCDSELEMAASSKNATEYAKKYEAYLRKLLSI